MLKKKTNKPGLSKRRLDRKEQYELQLYISGATEQSRLALTNIKAIAEKYLEGRYHLVVIDLYQQPERASEQEIIAVPMLIKKLPLPLRRMVGDLTCEDRVLIGLDLVPKPVTKEAVG